MKRRSGFALAVISVALLVFVSRSGSAAERPNIIVILADDLGWGDLACYGNAKASTPHLDRMAAEGVRFTQFYSTCPYCAPSRAALLTGRYQSRSGVTGNPAPDAGIDDIGIPDSELTLAEALKSAGYGACCIGKWHLGHKPEFHPLRHGFDEYLGILYSNDMRPVRLLDGENVIEYPLVQATLTRRYTERALAFIEKNKERPFFLYLPHAMPHKPLAPSEAFYRQSGKGLYADVLAELDWSVGAILAKVKELRLDEKTLILFTSDNGPWYGGSTGGLRGMKGNTWEGGIRVPLIARWPGKIAGGRVSHEPAVMVDLFATAVSAASVPMPEGRKIDGMDMFPLMTSAGKSPHEAIFSMQGPRLATVRSGRWKLHLVGLQTPKVLKAQDEWVDPRAPDGVTILAPYEQYHPSQYPGVLSGDATKALSLFDLEADPAEGRDVAAEHPEIVERLKALADKMAAQLPR